MPDEQPKGEGAEGDASEPQGAASASEQIKPWWEVRGFKSEDEALSAWDEGRRSLTETQTKVATMEKTIQVMMSATPVKTEGAAASKDTPGYRRYFEGLGLEEAYASGDANKFTEVLMSGVDRQIRERAAELYQQHEQARKLFVDFYGENKDLQPYQDLVKLYAQEIAGENPNMTVEQAFKETARRAREKIAAIKKGEPASASGDTGAAKPPKDTLPHTGAGGAGEGSTAKPDAKAAPAHDDVAAEVLRRTQERSKRTVLR